VLVVACTEINASRPLRFEASRGTYFDDVSSTRVEERPREFVSSKKEPNGRDATPSSTSTRVGAHELVGPEQHEAELFVHL